MLTGSAFYQYLPRCLEIHPATVAAVVVAVSHSNREAEDGVAHHRIALLQTANTSAAEVGGIEAVTEAAEALAEGVGARLKW